MCMCVYMCVCKCVCVGGENRGEGQRRTAGTLRELARRGYLGWKSLGLDLLSLPVGTTGLHRVTRRLPLMLRPRGWPRETLGHREGKKTHRPIQTVV